MRISHVRLLVILIGTATSAYCFRQAYLAKVARQVYTKNLDAVLFALDYVSEKAARGKYRGSDEAAMKSDYEFAKIMFHSK